MIRYDAGTTNPTLLGRLGDWRDHGAWVDFVLRYDPLIRSNCRRFRLDAEATEELCQRIWIEVARRMRSFRYDPGRTFRGWLGRLCRSRAIDLLRQKKAEPAQPPAGPPAESLWHDTPLDLDADEADGSDRALLLRLAEEVQRSVRRRVDGRTWDVFWTVDVEGRSVREAAEEAGMTYYAAFAARKRVGRMLREEGQRLLGERCVPESEVGGPRTD